MMKHHTHLCNIIEVFNADAAADEQLSGAMLQVREVLGGGGVANSEVMPRNRLPNLKIVNKDKPHGARRITSRAWKCDLYLGKLVD